jgi:hypothetical protein
VIKSRTTFYLALCLALILYETIDASEVLAQIAEGGGGAGGSSGNPGWWNGTETEPFAGGVIREAYCDIIDLLENNLGGLFMAAAGILAFGAAAFGDLKHGVTALVTGIGAFALSAMVSLYFGQLCGGGAGNGRTINQDLTRTNLEFNAKNTHNAALAIAVGRNADFSQAATLNQTEADPEGEEFDVFDRDMLDFGEEF